MEWFKKGLPLELFQEATDVHSHLLPSVDDGFKTREESLTAMKYLEELGFRQIIFTPHVMQEYESNKRDYLTFQFEEFCKIAQEQTGIKLFLAAEYMLDAKFATHRNEGWLTLGDAKPYILVETSYMYKEADMDQNLYELMLEGYTPVIAHPERYQYATKETYEQWTDSNYRLQLNLLSLADGYGRPSMEKALYLLDKDMYYYVGTDLHQLEKFIRLFSHIKLKTTQIDKLFKLYEHNRELLRVSNK